MHFDWIIVVVMLVLACSTFIRTAFGFGDAILAMPLLAMAIGVKTAAPLIAFFSLIISTVILVSNRRSLKFDGLWKLIIPVLIGTPLGLLFLSGASEGIVKLVLALVIILFGLYNIFKPELFVLEDDRYSYIFGLVSGVLGGAYNTNGPPIIIYGSLRRWESAHFRTLLQGVFLPTNIFIITGHALAGLWTVDVFRYFLFSLPVVGVTMFAGNKFGNSMPSEKFNRIVNIILLGLGAALLVQAVR